MSTRNISRHSVPDLIRRFSVLIAFFWLGLAVVTNVFVPQLETVAQAHNVSLSPQMRRRCRPVNASARCFTNSIPTVRR
jgi:uncharacterized membrane protein YdfJ with MMPL/SSD domain